MTREEAIKILADLTDNPFLHTWEEQNKALHMAIEALQFAKHFDLLKEYQSLQEVVRCKDCKYHNGSLCDIYLQPRMDTDFCNHGERLCNHNWREGGDLE